MELGKQPMVSGRARKALPGQERHRHEREQPRQERVYPSWRDLDEDVVDAEAVEDDPLTGGARERLRDGARSFFGGAKQKAEERDRRRRAERARAADESEEMSEREQLLKLRAEVRLAGEQCMTSLRDSKLLLPGFSEEEQQREFDVMHRVYMQMMVHGCVKPLSRGVNPSSVIQSVGMLMTMRLLSRDFRQEMDKYLQPVKDKLQSTIDSRTKSVTSHADDLAQRHNRLIDVRTQARTEKLEAQLEADPSLADDPGFQERTVAHQGFVQEQDGRKHDRGDYLSKRWQRRMEEMEHRERGHREMFTPESAAMTEVALMENAFWKMREGGDVDEIDKSYRAMRSRLRGQMDDDGLNREEVVKRARMIIGERMEAEPELRLMLNGVAHGRIRKAAPHMEQMAGSDRVREVWTGEFEDNLGQQIKNDGMFTLRRPMNSAEHQVQMGTTMKDSMLRALHSDDPHAYGASVLGYLGGFAHRREGGSGDGVPPILAGPLEQSETMQAAMAVDGLTDEQAQMVYSNAFTDAMEAVAEAHPGIDEELNRAFGDDWQSTLQDAVEDPRRFYARHWAGQHGFEAGPEGPTRPKPFVSDWGYSARGAAEGSDYQPA